MDINQLLKKAESSYNEAKAENHTIQSKVDYCTGYMDGLLDTETIRVIQNLNGEITRLKRQLIAVKTQLN